MRSGTPPAVADHRSPTLRLRRHAGVLCVLVLLQGHPRRVPAAPAPDALLRGSTLWRPDPKLTSRRRELSRALTLLRRALSPTRRTVRRPLLLLRALTHLTALGRRAPTDPEVWYWLGWASQRAQDELTAMAAWRHLLRIAPNHHAVPDVSFSLGVLLAKHGRYAESIQVYRLGMPRATRLSTRSIMASNCAESAMATGDLDLAVHLYRRSLALRPRNNRAAWWGLAISLDRQERTAAAEHAARQALLLDPTLRGLRGRGVFFVPSGDVHYYLGMAYEAADRVQEAVLQFQRFLRRLPRSRYAPRALEHLLQLQAQRKRLRPAAAVQMLVPKSATRAARRLLGVVERCYRQRARRFPVPEGLLPLQLWLSRGRVQRLSRGFSVRTVTDARLLRCVRDRLVGRRLAAPPALRRLIVTIQLELVP